MKFSFFKQFLPNFHKKMIHDIVKNSWVSWIHASYTPILVKKMIIIQNLILCINEKITLLRVGFEPVTVQCLKYDKDLAKMNLSLWHRAIEPTDMKMCLDMIKYYSKGCWSPTPLAVNKLGNLWQ